MTGAFKLYDIDCDGYITRDEMYLIVDAIYQMIGNTAQPNGAPLGSGQHPHDRVDRIFEQLDRVLRCMFDIHPIV